MTNGRIHTDTHIMKRFNEWFYRKIMWIGSFSLWCLIETWVLWKRGWTQKNIILKALDFKVAILGVQTSFIRNFKHFRGNFCSLILYLKGYWTFFLKSNNSLEITLCILEEISFSYRTHKFLSYIVYKAASQFYQKIIIINWFISS